MSFFSKETPAYAIIGLGRFGSAVAETLCQSNKSVILIDRDADRVREFRELSDYAYIIKNFTYKAFEEVGIGDVDTAVICVGENLDANLLATLYCLKLDVPNIIAKANTIDQGEILKKLGARVVYPERETGIRLANQLINQRVVEYLTISTNLDLAEIGIPPELVGKRLIDIPFRQKWKINVVAIQTLSATIEEIDPEYVFQKDDIIIVIGAMENIQRFEEDAASETLTF